MNVYITKESFLLSLQRKKALRKPYNMGLERPDGEPYWYRDVEPVEPPEEPPRTYYDSDDDMLKFYFGEVDKLRDEFRKARTYEQAVLVHMYCHFLDSHMWLFPQWQPKMSSWERIFHENKHLSIKYEGMRRRAYLVSIGAIERKEKQFADHQLC